MIRSEEIVSPGKNDLISVTRVSAEEVICIIHGYETKRAIKLNEQIPDDVCLSQQDTFRHGGENAVVLKCIKNVRVVNALF